MTRNPLLNLLEKFNALDKEIYLMKCIAALLNWDTTVNMPIKASIQRAEQESLISVRIHELSTSRKLVNLLKRLSQKKFYRKLSDTDRARVDLYNHLLKKTLKVPKKYVEEYSKAASLSHQMWEESRKKESYETFASYLKKIFELKKQEAKYISPKTHPYNIFLDEFERDITMNEIDAVFDGLKQELITLLKKIRNSPNYMSINKKRLAGFGSFPAGAQLEICDDISRRIIVDTGRFSSAESTHPFMVSLGADDLRITTAVRSDPFFSFSSTAHEAGHALYESNFDTKIRGTILVSDSIISFAMHESQSRLWEKIICQSKYFWKGYYPYYSSIFLQLKKVRLEDFYKMINLVEPSLVRIEADELTYSLHIIIRYEIERGVLDGTIKFCDIEKTWNKKYAEYLGVTPSKPTEGVLQDSHWASGLIGYFPTYTLGSIYAVMLYNQMKKENPQLEQDIEKLDFTFIRNWLKEHIHKYGASKTTKELIRNACGKDLDVKEYVEYLKNKYYAIYGIRD
jgi:carboxypeptidase Taq